MSANGLLEFTLGLETAGFIGSLGRAGGEVKTFVAGLLGLGSITSGLFDAIEKGTALEHLSKRTGRSVADLYELQRGFQAVGLMADDVSPALYAMQRSLGGVNEMGERTEDIFTRMGLNIGELKGKGGAAAFEDIIKALSHLNQNDAAKAAASIFGRGQGSNMVELSRSTEDFADGMRKAAGTAEKFQENAEAFKRISLTLDEIKMKGLDLFAGIAAGAERGIQDVLSLLNEIDLSALGTKIGNFISAFTQSFKDGTITTLIATSITAGFDVAIAMLPALAKEAVDILADSLGNAGRSLARGWLGFGDVSENDLAGMSEPSGGLNHSKINADTNLTEEQKQRMHQALFRSQSTKGEAEAGIATAVQQGQIKERARAFSDALAEAVKALQPLSKIIADELAKFPKVFSKNGAGGKDHGEQDSKLDQSINYKPQFTSLEKIGLVLPGLSSFAAQGQDPKIRAANEMVHLLRQVVAKLGSARSLALTEAVFLNHPL